MTDKCLNLFYLCYLWATDLKFGCEKMQNKLLKYKSSSVPQMSTEWALFFSSSTAKL